MREAGMTMQPGGKLQAGPVTKLVVLPSLLGRERAAYPGPLLDGSHEKCTECRTRRFLRLVRFLAGEDEQANASPPPR